MTSLKIEKKDELEKFLKILVEESITQASVQLTEDNEQKYYEKQMQLDKKRFKSSNISEDDDDVAMTATAEVEEEETEELPEVVPEEEPEDRSPKSTDNEDIIVSYFRIRDELNTIRSGSSLKDDETKIQLEQYVDRLSDDERKVLYTFLKSIANIMTAQETGDSAQDPSEPPTSLDVTVSEKETESESQSTGKQKTQKRRPDNSREEAEDTTPPIQVGRQVTESVRIKVRKLMSL